MYTRFPILSLYTVCVAVCLLAVITVFTSCRGDEVVYPTIGTTVTEETHEGGLYVLCEGNMGSNKARLDYMNLQTGTYYSNWYGAQNPKQLKELGDVGNDIQAYGQRLYAVINCSHKVEVMDRKAWHIGQVDIPNCRYMAFYGDKMYVSAYVGSMTDADMLGSVFEVDTASLIITREVKVGHQPDELCIVDGTLYVANSGGYLVNRYDSTVSVIDLNTFTEKQKIPVGMNPTRLRADSKGQLWVCCQGNYAKVAPCLTVLSGGTVVKRIATTCANISIKGETAYILDNQENRIRAFSITDYSEKAVSIDISTYENPYGLLAMQDVLYVTDAKNYVSSGVLHCYTYDGTERWQAMTGDIPGHLCRVPEAYDLQSEDVPQDTAARSPYIAHVYEYMPGMGQFVNVLPPYEEGDDAEAMCRKCEAAVANNAGGMICLGGCGGYITFGFDHAVENQEGRDIQILGNAFLLSGSSAYGSSEPGIVLVSRDDNGNGLPDDKWYELKGSLYDDPNTVHDYAVTYTREGDTLQNPFHQQPYYPQWLSQDAYTLKGARLPSQTETVNNQTVQRILEYGYADNKPNTDLDGTSFDISWAVDATGRSVSLPYVDFIRVYTAVDEVNALTGEISTEISGAIDLHIKQ